MRKTGASSPGGSGSVRAGRGRTTKSVSVAASRFRQPASRLDGAVEEGGRGGIERFDLVVSDARFPEPRLVDEQRITGAPLLQLLRRPVALGVALVVAVPTVGGRLDDGGPGPVAGGAHDVLHHGRDRHHVVPVDRDIRNAVAGCPELQ